MKRCINIIFFVLLLGGCSQTKPLDGNFVIRDFTPENILFLTSFLDTFAFNTQANKTDAFFIGGYLDTLKKISSYDLPPLPVSPPLNPRVKFHALKIKQ